MNKTCPKCGLSNPSEAAFCHNCAAPLNNTPQAPPPFQAGGGQGYMTAPPESQKPMIAMILAIGAFLCCGPLLGIPAAILGWLELTAIKEGKAPAKGKTMASIGLWGGIAATVIHIVGYVIFMALGMLGGMTGGY